MTGTATMASIAGAFQSQMTSQLLPGPSADVRGIKDSSLTWIRDQHWCIPARPLDSSKLAVDLAWCDGGGGYVDPAR